MDQYQQIIDELRVPDRVDTEEEANRCSRLLNTRRQMIQLLAERDRMAAEQVSLARQQEQIEEELKLAAGLLRKG